MHLTKRILPFIITEALRGNTWAGDAVFDSPGDIGSIRVGEKDEHGLFVAVYCDEWDNKGEQVPDEYPSTDNGDFRVIIEVGAARPIAGASDTDGPQTTLAATDAGLEWSIAMVSRQCIDTLLDVRPAFPWSRLWQDFTSNTLRRYQIRRGGAAADGRSPAPRYASCVSILKVSSACAEPTRGQKLVNESRAYGLWARLIAMMEAREDLLPMSRLIRAHIEPMTGAELPDLSVDAARMWVSEETMRSIGLANWEHLRIKTGVEPSCEPIRHDVPMEEHDMASWVAGQGPDPSQGTGNAG